MPAGRESSMSTGQEFAASLSTDQIAAFVELARHGSLRAAAARLLISEQGLRNRVLALEARLGVQLYRKSQGPRRASPLTEQGQRSLPSAIAFLDQARELCEAFSGPRGPRLVHVAASQYLLRYVLIDAIRRFHTREPHIQIRVSTLAERDIEEALLRDPELAPGRCRAVRTTSGTRLHALVLAFLEPDRSARASPAPSSRADARRVGRGRR